MMPVPTASYREDEFRTAVHQKDATQYLQGSKRSTVEAPDIKASYYLSSSVF